jgi:hypothetical protein
MRKGFRQFVAGVDLNSTTPYGAFCRGGSGGFVIKTGPHGSLGLHIRRSPFGRSIRKTLEQSSGFEIRIQTPTGHKAQAIEA